MSLFETGGGKFILCFNFDIKKLPINLPKYYRERFECFSHCSAASGNNVLSHFVIQDQIQLVLNNQEASIIEATFKKVYRESNESFSGVYLDWKKVHSLPFLVALAQTHENFNTKL